jgi:2,3-bisphosphoglycerate-dependent phosphoglycerate mutase
MFFQLQSEYMTTEKTRICFVRHGETDWNIEQRMQGHIDLALNALGEAQAAALGRHFAHGRAAALYSSDLLRARQTAQPIAEALCLPLLLDPALRERHFGRCEGLTPEEVAARYVEDARAFASRDPDYAAPGGGESRRQHQRRVFDCIVRLAAEHRGQAIVIVTHGGVLDVISRHAHGLPLDAPRDYPIPNAGINWVVAGSAHWQIESWGEPPHLQ